MWVKKPTFLNQCFRLMQGTKKTCFNEWQKQKIWLCKLNRLSMLMEGNLKSMLTLLSSVKVTRSMIPVVVLKNCYTPSFLGVNYPALAPQPMEAQNDNNLLWRCGKMVETLNTDYRWPETHMEQTRYVLLKHAILRTDGKWLWLLVHADISARMLRCPWSASVASLKSTICPISCAPGNSQSHPLIQHPTTDMFNKHPCRVSLPTESQVQSSCDTHITEL